MSSINQDITLTQSLADDPQNQVEKWLEDVEIHARNLLVCSMGYLRRLNPSRYRRGVGRVSWQRDQHGGRPRQR